MPVEVVCANPSCARHYNVSETAVGRSVRCKACGQTFLATAERQTVARQSSSSPQLISSSVGTGESLGRFVIREQLGAGAFGTVYRAFDPVLKREVALKVLKREVSSDAKRVERFLREAKAAAGLHHPNIVAVYDAGQDGDRYYIAGALIDGKPLADSIPDDGAEFRRAAQLARELADALAYAHEQGVVHRDVKPANAMVDRQGKVHLMDFGLAARSDEESKLTSDGAVMGTPAYMSPEQAKGQKGEAKPATDQYAAGVVLYELLTGKVPFTGPLAVVLHNAVHTEPDPPRKYRPGVPRDLETVCLKAMAKRPEDRYATCRDFADDLRRWLEGEPVTARRLSAVERVARWVRKNRHVAASLAVTFAALLVGTAVSAWQANRANTESQVAKDQQQRADAEAREAVRQTINAQEAAKREKNAATELARQLKQMRLLLDFSRLRQAQNAIDNNAAHVARDHLGAVAPENRCLVWRFLNRQIEWSQYTLDHLKPLSSIAVSADGSRIVTGALDMARVWEGGTGRMLFQLKGHAGFVQSVAISADGTRVVTGSEDMTARVWDGKTGQPLLELKGHTGRVMGVTVSADGSRIVTGSGDGIARLWDGVSGKPISELKGHTSHVTAVAISADGTRVVTGSEDKSARVWDGKTGQPLLELKGHTGPGGLGSIRCVAMSADGARIVTGSSDKTARVWDGKTGQTLLVLRGHADYVLGVAVSTDGSRVVTASSDTTARAWDGKTGELVSEFKGHTAPISGVAVVGDGTQFFTASEDKTARAWQTNADPPLLEHKVQKGSATCVTVSANGTRVVIGFTDSTARVVDGGTGQVLLELKGHKDTVRCVASSADGSRIVTGSEDKTSRIWDGKTGQCLWELKDHTGEVKTVAITPDGSRVVTGSKDTTALVWNGVTGQSLLELKGHTDSIWSVAMSADGARIVTGSSDKTARVWDGKTGQTLLVLRGHADYVLGVAISTDGSRVVTGSRDNTTWTWDGRTGQRLVELKGHARYVLCVAINSDGSRVLTGSRPRVWDAQTGEPLLELQGHIAFVTSVAMSADGSRIVTASPEKVSVWSAGPASKP